MANYCGNCGNKISFNAEKYRLVYSKISLCGKCKRNAETLMQDFMKSLEDLRHIEYTQDDLDKVMKEYSERAERLSYKTEVRDALKTELKGRCKDRIPSVKRSVIEVSLSHDEVLEKIRDMAENSFSSTEIAGHNSIEIDGVRTDIIALEKFYLRTSSYASLTIGIVSNAEKTVVTAIGAGGGEGLMNIDLGAANSFEYDFWELLLKANN